MAVAAISASGILIEDSRRMRPARSATDAVDTQLSERFEQEANLGFVAACADEQLRSGDHRIVEPVVERIQSSGPSQVIDEDVGIDE